MEKHALQMENERRERKQQAEIDKMQVRMQIQEIQWRQALRDTALQTELRDRERDTKDELKELRAAMLQLQLQRQDRESALRLGRLLPVF